MKIGLSYDLKEAFNPAREGPEDAFEEYDSVETVEALRQAIEARGHSVLKLGGGLQFLHNILSEKVDFVFNISEGLGSYRSREAQVPSVLEMLNIPYTGADPQCLAVCLDKHLTKKIVAVEGIPTPAWCVVDQSNFAQIDWKTLPFPAFVKPVWEGSSKGIRLKSLVRSPAQLQELVNELLKAYRQPVLVEEFISGEEVTVGMVGNNPAKIIGIMRVVPRQKETDFIYSLEVKRDYENLVDYECPAKLPARIVRKIEEYSRQAFKLLGCRDFARLDYRVATDGTPFFLEVNPLAGLNPRSSDIVIMAGLVNLKYNDLIGAILDAAFQRNAL
ncbi:MAG TPA: ATP-grasp domain-containing protein [Dehalococcoidales bacterium]|nr:ATP-grasp domain-containing protein [Dehalococcoidales bacterium]